MTVSWAVLMALGWSQGLNRVGFLHARQGLTRHPCSHRMGRPALTGFQVPSLA